MEEATAEALQTPLIAHHAQAFVKYALHYSAEETLAERMRDLGFHGVLRDDTVAGDDDAELFQLVAEAMSATLFE